jgi:hypothetical protein
MFIKTSKDAAITASVLASLTDTTYNLRSLECLAREAGASLQDTQRVVSNMGLTSKRRRGDGAMLYGIEGRVEHRDVVHTPIQPVAASAPAPVQETSHRYDGDDDDELVIHVRQNSNLDAAKGRVILALEDTRWRKRTVHGIAEAANISDQQTREILALLDVQWSRSREYVWLRSRG